MLVHVSIDANVQKFTPTPSPRPSNQHLRANAAMNSPQRKITGPRPMGSRSPSGQQGLNNNVELQHSDTVIRRKPIPGKSTHMLLFYFLEQDLFWCNDANLMTEDQESLQSYRSSLDSEIF